MKIRPVGAELFHVDGRTDMTKIEVAFRSFANAPKNIEFGPIQHSMVGFHKWDGKSHNLSRTNKRTVIL